MTISSLSKKNQFNVWSENWAHDASKFHTFEAMKPPPPDPLEKLRKQAAQLPLLPGVYQFLNAAGEVIYVGKAKSLRRRIASYFMERNVNDFIMEFGDSGFINGIMERYDPYAKSRAMVRQAVELRHIITPSEADALLLENNMIKRLQPRYNLQLKDDKTYPWIVIRNEPFPRVISTRKVVRDDSHYFGPYASVVMQKGILEMLHGVFQFRTCALNLAPEQVAKGKYSICLQYHLSNCKGPCVGKQSEKEYAEAVSMAVSILNGNMRPTRQYLERRMHEAAQTLHFEEAERYKIRLGMLEHYQSKSVIVSRMLTNLDAVSMLLDEGVAYVNLVRIVQGAVVHSFTAEFSLGAEEDQVAIFTHALRQISEEIAGQFAREVVVPFLPEANAFPKTKFTLPKMGEKLKLLEFSQQGAKLYRLEKMKNMEIKDPERHTLRIMEAMQRELRLPAPPRHIECFDNSNLQGSHPVASCVVFRDGKPARKEYRHFNIKTVAGPDDFASMREVVGRRYRRLLDEGAELPDLIVVDGGKGQLSSAYSVLQELGVEGRLPIIGLAKRIEEVFYPNDPEPYYLDRKGEPLKVIMHLRDEAHRFGITFHRQKRSLAFIRSELESIPGVGAASVTKLLRTFKTVSAIKKAPYEKLAAIVGQPRAEAIRKYFCGAF